MSAVQRDLDIAASIIVSALFGAQDHAWLDGLRRAHFPPERNLLPAHLTLFHHLPPSLAPELKRRLAAATRAPRPQATTDGVLNLGRGVAIRIRSPELAAIRADLADAFAASLVPQDRAGWRPHVTVQNKVSAEAAHRLFQELSGATPVRPIAIVGLAAWWYRGGPWEPLSRHMFRG